MSNSDPKSTNPSNVSSKKQAQILPGPMVKPNQDPSAVAEALEEAEFVTQVTNSTGETQSSEKAQIEAFDRAKAAAHHLNELADGQKQAAKDYRIKAESQGRIAIFEMLRVAECFLKQDGTTGGTIDMEAMHGFLKTRSPKGKLHGGVDNPWQPLARLCFPEKAGGTVTKFGYVLAALDARKIRSDKVEEAFDTPEIVGNPRSIKTGMRKYIFFFHEDNRPEGEEPKDPFDKWDEERLKKSAMFFLKKLYENGLISSKVESIKEILSEKALS